MYTYMESVVCTVDALVCTAWVREEGEGVKRWTKFVR